MASPRSTPQSNPTQALKCRGPSLSHPRLSVALLNWGPTGMGCLISRLSLEPSSLKSGFNGGGHKPGGGFPAEIEGGGTSDKSFLPKLPRFRGPELSCGS